MGAEAAIYLGLLAVTSVVILLLALAARAEGRRAARAEDRAQRAIARARAWQAAYERTRAELLETRGVDRAGQLIDLAMTDTAYTLYHQLEQMR